MPRERVAVVGAGLMGRGIAQVFAHRGHDVALFDSAAAARDHALERIRSNLRALGQDEHALDRITLFDRLAAAVSGADIVFEAAPEKLEIKQSLFVELEQATGPDCILASNTSVIPITDISSQMSDPSRALGTHWWNPPYLIPLVEVIQGRSTATHAVESCMSLLKRAGKIAVHVKRDIPGFVDNRLQHALWREAISLVAKGVCDAQTVDLVVKNSFGIRLPILGPLENADLVGLDLTLDIHNVILRHLEANGEPDHLLRRLVAENRLGMKSGQGLYPSWSAAEAATVSDRLLAHLRQAKTEVEQTD